MGKVIRHGVIIHHHNLDKIVTWPNTTEPERFYTEEVKTPYKEIAEEKYTRLIDEYSQKADRIVEVESGPGQGYNFYYKDFGRNVMTQIYLYSLNKP